MNLIKNLVLAFLEKARARMQRTWIRGKKNGYYYVSNSGRHVYGKPKDGETINDHTPDDSKGKKHLPTADVLKYRAKAVATFDKKRKLQKKIDFHAKRIERLSVDRVKNAAEIARTQSQIDKLNAQVPTTASRWQEVMAEAIVHDHPDLYERAESYTASGEAYNGYRSRRATVVPAKPKVKESSVISEPTPDMDSEGTKLVSGATDLVSGATDLTPDMTRKWKNNGDGTYTSPNGDVWRKAKAGGEISPVNGNWFKGGSLMPIHGKHVKSSDDESARKGGEGDGTTSVGSGGRRESTKKDKQGKSKYVRKERDVNGNFVEVPDDHEALTSLVGGHPTKSHLLPDHAADYLGLTRQQLNEIADLYNSGVVSLPRDKIKRGDPTHSYAPAPTAPPASATEAVQQHIDERNASATMGDEGPREGERNADGLVFRDGRWRRDEVEPEITGSQTPKQTAEAEAKKTASEYAFARESAVSNLGEDLKGSARHKRNEWRGLDQAEKDGNAQQWMTRSHLTKAYPHDLAATITPGNAVQHLMAHHTINGFPDGFGTEKEIERYLSRGKTTAEELRKQYLDTYQSIKAKAEETARSGVDPKQFLNIMEEHVGQQVRLLRQSAGSGKGAGDPFNPVANALIPLYRSLETPWGKPKANSVAAKAGAFREAIQAKYPTIEEQASAVVGHVTDIMEGDSLNKSFGKVQGKTGFKASDLYLSQAERVGGRVIDTSSVKAGSDYAMNTLGMRGLQWGNSVSDDERQHHLGYVANSFADLADVTGLPEKAMSLNGTLGLAIGARGKGTALAHFEPGTKVINLTRKNGVGSLAHEWAHALSNHVAGGRTDATSRPDNSEVGTAVKELQKAMADSGSLARIKKQLQKDLNEGLIGEKLANYYLESDELFARHFEKHVQHVLKSQGRQNTYLSGVKNHGYWPTEEEVAKIQPAMDNLLKVIAKVHFNKQTAN